MKHRGGFVLAGLLFVAGQVRAADLAVTAKAGTLGLGVEVTGGLTEQINVRGAFHPAPTIGRDFEEEEISYSVDLKLLSASAGIDWHPGGGGFHLSGALILNRNEIDGSATNAGSYDIGDRTYQQGEVGSLFITVDSKGVKPYAGLGFGNAVGKDKKLGVVFDLGVMFAGSPNVTLSASGPIASSSQFQQDLAQEEQNLEEELKPVKYYPVVSLGISYKF